MRPDYEWLHLVYYIIKTNCYFEHIAFKADPCLNHSSCSNVQRVNTCCALQVFFFMHTLIERMIQWNINRLFCALLYYQCQGISWLNMSQANNADFIRRINFLVVIWIIKSQWQDAVSF